MNEIDDMLQRHRAKPRRQLSSTFTSETIARLRNGERPEPRPRWKEFIPMKLRHIHKPVAIGMACAIALIAGGTTYAGMNGWNVQTMFGGEKDLGNGLRIVQVDAKNCPHIDAFNITDKNRSQRGTYYYKISQESQLANQQVVDMVTATCQADAEAMTSTPASNAVQVMLNDAKNHNKVVGSYGNETITAITNDSITVTFPAHGMGEDKDPTTLTYTRIDPDAVITDGPNVSSFANLRVGDHVFIQYRASGDALLHSETLAPGDVNPSEQVVVSIQKLSPAMLAYFEFGERNGKDFVQVTPCDSQASGYCTVEEFFNKPKN